MTSPSKDPVLNQHFKGHTGSVTGLAFNPVSDRLISCSSDKNAMLWPEKTNLRAIRFSNHEKTIHDVSWARDGKIFTTASADGTVRFWTPKITGTSWSFKAHTSPIRSVDLSETGDQFLTASEDKSVKLWRMENKKLIRTFADHKNWVRSARFSPFEPHLMASCSDDRSTRVFNIELGTSEQSFIDNKASGMHLAWHPQNIIAVALSDGKVKLFDLRAHQLIQVYKIHAGSVNSIAIHPNGRYLLTGGEDSLIKVLDITIARPIYTLELHNGPVYTVAFNKSGDHFASGGSDKSVRHVASVWKLGSRC